MDRYIPILTWFAMLLCGSTLLVVVWRFVSSIAVGLRQDRLLAASESDRHRFQEEELAMTLHQTRSDESMLAQDASWYTVTVVKIAQESEDTRSFYLLDSSGEPLRPFLPGQHILVERPAGAIATRESRCYSLSDECDVGYWRITVKKSGVHPTSVSRWLHEEVREGDPLRVRGPSGAFYLRSCTARNAVFLSAGVGITPMIPMLQQAIQRPHGSIHFFAQYRDIDHAPFAERLLAFSQKNPTVRMRLWLSRFPAGVQGSETNTILEGKFTASDVCLDIDSLEDTDVYLCGPEGWVQTLCNGLSALGVPESNLRYELFHSTASAPISPSPSAPATCSVHFQQSNRLAEFAATFPNLLSFAVQSDVPINSGCRTGACGSCAVRLLHGKVRYTRKPQYPLKPNEILPCVCVPDGNIVVDA